MDFKVVFLVIFLIALFGQSQVFADGSDSELEKPDGLVMQVNDDLENENDDNRSQALNFDNIAKADSEGDHEEAGNHGRVEDSSKNKDDDFDKPEIENIKILLKKLKDDIDHVGDLTKNDEISANQTHSFIQNYICDAQNKTDEDEKRQRLRELKCLPGRTVIRITGKKSKNNANKKNGTDPKRRFHTKGLPAEGETCHICICSVSGLDESCMTRPARNVNECLRVAKISAEFQKNEPYEHWRTLAGRIRRDYIWHRDDIPYLSTNKCHRGVSFYTNSIHPEAGLIDDVGNVRSQLDFPDKNICYYCICDLNGNSMSCIKRDYWFCSYIRTLRGENGDPEEAQRAMYYSLFKADRPAYFRHISYRLRRRMDDAINGLVDPSGGDTTCCDHPSGHRRSLHKKVRTKLMQLRHRVTKENLMSKSPTGDYEDFIVNNDK